MKTRTTDQRRVIRKVLEDNPRPLSVAEIHELGRQAVPGLGIATIYRNVKEFLEIGWIRAIDLPGGVPRYEVNRQDHHHHFHCGSCDRMFDIPHCSESYSAAVEGYDVLAHDVLFFGRCADCGPDAPAPTAK